MCEAGSACDGWSRGTPLRSIVAEAPRAHTRHNPCQTRGVFVKNLVVLAAGLAAIVSACKNADPGSSGSASSGDSAGMAGGGTPTGGSPAGGASTGSAVGSGGETTGGNASGGTATGGRGTGGAEGGQAKTGGSATGGRSSGGAASVGGTWSGGAATSGSGTAGKATGGGGQRGGAGGESVGGTESGGGTGGSASSSAGAPSAGASSGGAPTTEPAVVKNGESRLAESGLTVVSYGGYLNGESFQQDGITSYNGYQYSAFWNTNRNVVLVRRRLPTTAGAAPGAWEKFDFTDYELSADDAHNTISLGVAPGDGTLHIAFDHHGSDLHYRRSVTGLLTDPETATWAASSFSSVTSALVGTTVIRLVTYPRFVTEPGGERLLLSMRIGESGSGDEALWEYDSASGTWSSLGEYIEGTDDSLNAYLHGIAYTRGGTRLHASWCWRETPDAQTNHDLVYVYSDDDGRTWKNDRGDTVGRTGASFIGPDTAGITVWPIAQNRGLINQEHMAVDAAGRVHVLLSHMPDAQADDSNFTSSRGKSEYFDYVRDSDGNWTRHGLGLEAIENFRGKLAISSSNTVYAILPDLRIAGASARDGFERWTLLDTTDSGRFFSDPLIDTARLEGSDELTVYCPERSSTSVWALEYSLE
jgi:hypothetical protein